MIVQITLDYYDGSQSKAIEVDLAEISLRDMTFKMMQAKVCGFTVTKVANLVKAVEKSKNDHD